MAEDGTATAATEGSGEAYRGVFGAIPYAIRSSDSWTFRAYGVVGTLVAAFLALLFSLAIVDVFAATTGGRGGTFSFSRAFFVFVGLLVVGPLLAPLLSVARTHRLAAGDGRYDRTMGALGFLLIVSLYVCLVASVPPEQQEAYDGLGAGVVRFLYDLPQLTGIVFPAVATAAILEYHRRYGRA
jgi:hypothetical protein